MVTLLTTVLRARPATKPVRPVRAPLDRPSTSIGAFTAAEVMLTMRPKARHHAVDRRLDQLDRRQHVGVERLDPVVAGPVRKSPGGGPPALLTRMSGSGQAASAASRPSGVVMSPATSITFTPIGLRISSAVSSSASAPRAVR